VTRTGIVSVLSEPGDLQIVPNADLDSALMTLRQIGGQVVLLSVTTVDEAVIDGCQRIAAEFPASGVLLLTATVDARSLDLAARAGVAGYLMKNVEPHDLVMAVRRVARGGAVLDPTAARMLLDLVRQQPVGRAPDPLAELSAQERVIADLLADGLTNRQIAEAVRLSPHTVKTYVSSILVKLHLTRRSAVAALVGRIGSPRGNQAETSSQP
jgi:two-component system, NarL family, response regulator DevR